jgi:hypothetical protein
MAEHTIIVNNIATLNLHSTNPANGDQYITFEQFKTQVEECKTILEDCIIYRPSSQLTIPVINIHLGDATFSEEDQTLGWANNGTIKINQYNNANIYLNDISKHQNISVIIHEIFHVFGLFPNYLGGNISQITDNEGSTRRIYTGKNGLNGYKEVLLANNITIPEPLYICLEDDFPPGTINVHLEEAYHDGEAPPANPTLNPKGNEVINIDNQYYPTLWNEIMTGLLDKDYNFITPITIGCLEDLGYTINYNSQYIIKNSTNMKFIVNSVYKQLGTQNNYLTFGEKLYDIHYLNKLLKYISSLQNVNILIECAVKNWGNNIER